MADINSNIKVNIDTSDALAQLKLLQQQISAFQQAMRNAGAQNASAAAAMQQNLITSINATGKFRANVQTIKTSAESFTESLEKNKFSIGEYFRYAGGASKTFGKLFKSEYATITQVAKERVKELQTQYIKLGRDANGAMKAIAVKPLSLDMNNLATKTQIAAQKQQLFNQLMTQGSTSLLNFGKNTQWAGRQLMVGFTIPLTLMGQAASKAYMQIEAASVKFRRVYGDMNTTTEEANKMVKSVQVLANEFTKYGVAVADTMDMAAQAAAMGKTGADLIAQINNAAKLSILGGVDQTKALETTISLTNAFGVAAEDLGKNIDFLNAVENQTTLSIDDLTTAIPKAAPVVRQLGGDVKDLAFFMTAMKEGGINASEGANAIKSGLASLINPSEKASKFLQGFGINVKGIVEADKGNLKKTVVDFAKALDTLDPLNRARAIEQMFGKFQFSRLSTLFQNVIAEGSQASQVAELSKNSAEELAILSEREMKKISDSPMFKFQKSMQDMQAKLAPVGEAFLKAITPIIEFVSKILDGFNNLGEGTKNFVSMLILAVAGIGPILLMTFGLIANGVANIMKLFTNMKGFINKTTKPSDILGEQTQYMTTEQLRGAAVAASLDQAHVKLRQTFTSEKAALDELTRSYRQAVEAQQQYSGVPGIPTGNPNAVPKRYANGVSMVPGPKGAGDIIPALLSPGEAVIPAKHAQKYAPVIAGMVAGNLPGFESGTAGIGMRQSTIGPLNQKQTEGILRTGKTLKEISDEVYAGPYGAVPPEHYVRQIEPTSGHSFPAFQVGGIYEKADGSQVFVKPQMDLTSALAEVRGTQIARDAHKLTTPMQKIVAMMDPTDPEGMRKFIALESPLNEQIAKISTSFTKGQYFKQLVASLLRGDKDLGIGNLGGDILADVGPAGVFQTASGKRKLGGSINSMEEQAIINLLGVKGGAKRFFAESTSDIASKMSSAEYSASMKAEIQAVMPRLQATIASFGNLSPEEKAAYANMQQRLQAGMGVDWGKYQVMHSAVPPKKYALGGMVPGYVDGKDNVKKESDYTPKELYELFKVNETHVYGEMDINDPVVQEQLFRVYSQSQLEDYKQFKVLSNLTMSLPAKVNQLIKDPDAKTNRKGLSGQTFGKIYNAFNGKLSKTAKMSGIKNLSDSQSLEDIIGTKFAGEPLIKDSVFAKIVEQTINEQTAQNTSIGTAANLIWERTKQVGTIRPKRDSLNSGAWNEIITGMLKNDALKVIPGGEGAFPLANTPFGSRFGRIKSDGIGSKKTAEGRAIRKIAQDAANLWARSGNTKTPLPTVDLGSGKLTQLTWRDNSEGSGKFSTEDVPSYEVNRKDLSSTLGLNPGGLSSLVSTGLFPEIKFAKGGMIPGYARGIANVGPTGKPKASVFDIDDTLLDLSGWMENFKAENDKLPEGQKKKWYKEVAKDPKGLTAGINALKAAQIRGNKILLMTARPTVNDPYTLETLQKLGIDMNGVKLISRRDKDYRKPEQMKYDKTSAYMKYYDIEEFYDDMAKNRGAVSLLGINTINPLKLAGGTTGVLPQGFSAMPTQAEKAAGVAFIQNSPLTQIQRGDALSSLVAKSTIGKGSEMFRVPTIRQTQQLANKKVGDLIELGDRFTSVADQTQLQAIGMTSAGKLNTGDRERAVNTILKLIAGYDMPGIMNHASYNSSYKKDAFGDRADSYPFQSEGLLPPGLKGKITNITQDGDQKIIEVFLAKLAKGGIIPGSIPSTQIRKPSLWDNLLSIGTKDGEFSDRQLGSMVKYSAFPKNFKEWEPNSEFASAFRKYQKIKELEYSVPAMEKFASMYKPGMKKEQVMTDMYDSKGGERLFRRGNPELSGLVSKPKEQQLAKIEQVKQQVAEFYQSKEYAMLQGAKGKNASAWLMKQLRRTGQSNVFSAKEMKDRFADKKENMIIGAEVTAHDQKVQDAIDEGLSSGEIALLKQEALRHRTTRRLKVSTLKHPKDVGGTDSRYFGPGTYFAEDQLDSKKLFSTFGNNVYKLDLSDEEKEFVKNSKGYIDEATMIQKAQEYKHLLRNRGREDAWFGQKTIPGVFGAKWTDPFIQKLMEEGYIGYEHGKAFTDWYVGAKPGYGLKKTKYATGGIIPGYANGVFSVPGPKGAGDVVPAMLSPGEAVIPADRAAQHRGLIKGMIAGNLPGYAKGTIIPGYKYGKDNVPGNVPGGGFFSADSESLVLEQSKVVALEEALVAKKKDLTRLTREQIEEQMAVEDESYRLLIEEQQQLRMKSVLTEEEKKQLQKNDEVILQKEGVWKNDRNVEEKQKSGLSKLFTRTKTTGKIQGAMYGATAAAGALSTMGGPIGEAAGAALPAIGAMTSAMSMIPGPAGMVVGGLMAVATISAQIDAHFKKIREESYNLAQSMGAGNKAIMKFAEFAKKVSATEIMDKQRTESSGQFFNIVAGKKTFGQSFMEGESGKSILESVNASIKNGGTAKALEQMAQQLSSAVVSGVLTSAQAKSVAEALGARLKNLNFGIKVSARINALFGPDGENLNKDPVKTRINFSKGVVSDFVKNTQQGEFKSQLVDNTYMGIKGTMVQSVRRSSEEKTAMGGMIAAQYEQIPQIQQQALDSLDLLYQKRISDAEAAGKTAEAIKLQNEFLKQQKTLLERNAAQSYVSFAALAKLKKDSPDTYDAAKKASEEGFTKHFEGSGREAEAVIAKSAIDNLGPGATDTQRMVMRSAVTSDQLGLSQATDLSNILGNTEEGNKKIRQMLLASPVMANRAATFAGNLKDEATQYKFLMSIETKDPAKAKATLDALELFQKTTGIYADSGNTKMVEMMLTFATNNEGILSQINTDMNELSTNKVITIDLVERYVGSDVSNSMNKSKTFKLSDYKTKNEKMTFTTEYTTLYRMYAAGDATLLAEVNAWLAKPENRGKTQADYFATQADLTVQTRTADFAFDPNATDNNNNNQKESSWLDQYVKTARDAGKATQALTTGFADSSAALKKFGAAAPKLNGLFTQLKAAGASNDIIQAALGGDEATTKALIDVKTGKLKAGAKQILAGINLAIRQQKEIDWLGLTGAEKKQKYNDMYNADLEVLKISEDEINKRYDDRIKALDTINTLNERNSAQQQSTLTLADALAKGDIAAAARAALEKRKQDTSFALEDQKKNLELARTLELSKLVVDINGVQMTRAEVEEKIRINAEAITKAKATELELGIRIGQLAEREYSAVVNPVKKAAGGLIIPKGYAYGGGIYGTDTVPAMLTPGEFVVKKSSVDAIGIDKLNTINSGNMPSDSVYNYSINVNVATGADANDIARTVMTQIRQTESQRVRSNTY